MRSESEGQRLLDAFRESMPSKPLFFANGQEAAGESNEILFMLAYYWHVFAEKARSENTLGAPWKPFPPEEALREIAAEGPPDSIRASSWPIIIKGLPNPTDTAWGYSPDRGNCAGAKASSFMKKPGLLGRALMRRGLGNDEARQMWESEGSIVVPFPAELNDLFEAIADDPSVFHPEQPKVVAFEDIRELSPDASQPAVIAPDYASAHRIMEAAFRLLKRGWCVGALARNQDGRSVNPESSEAVSFSIEGAIDRSWVEARCPDDSHFLCHFNLGTAIDRLYPEFQSLPEVAGLLDGDSWLAFNDKYGQEGALRVVLLAARQLAHAADRA